MQSFSQKPEDYAKGLILMRDIIKGNLVFIKYMWKDSKLYFILKPISTVIGGLIPVIQLVMPKFIIDEITGQARYQVLGLLTFAFVLVLLAGHIIQSAIRYIEKLVVLRAQSNMTKDIMDNFKHIRLECYHTPSTYDRTVRAFRFATEQGAGMVDNLSNIISTMISLLSVIYIIVKGSPVLLGVMMLGVIVSLKTNNLHEKRRHEYRRSLTNSNRKASFIKNLFLDKESIKEIKINDIFDFLEYQIIQLNDTIIQKTRNVEFLFIQVSSLNLVTQLGVIAALLYVLGIEFMKGGMTFGDFTMYTNSAMQFNSLLLTIANSVSGFYRLTLEAQNYFEFMEDDSIRVRPVHGKRNLAEGEPISIEFKNVSFKYPGQQRWALENVSFRINAGEKILIVGHNGAGKTTLINLLMHLYEPQKGEILINGHNSEEYDPKKIFNTIGVVFQDHKLYPSFTIAENILFKSIADDNDEAELWEVIKKVGLYETVQNLMKSIHTPFGRQYDDDGVEFSGGECQRLALARAYSKEAGILILDEPSSALDPLAEQQLFDTINEMTITKTVLFISHRLSAVSCADRILLLKEGQVVEYGTHNQLMQNNGLYCLLYNIQSSKYHYQGMEKMLDA